MIYDILYMNNWLDLKLLVDCLTIFMYQLQTVLWHVCVLCILAIIKISL